MSLRKKWVSHVFLQCLIRDLILSTKTVSATVGDEEDFTTGREERAVPRRTLAADSWALDRYDMPVIQIKTNRLLKESNLVQVALANTKWGAGNVNYSVLAPQEELNPWPLSNTEASLSKLKAHSRS